MIFYFGFVLNILGIALVTYKTIKTNNIISPQMIVFLGIFIYLYLPATILKSQYINDDGYNFVLLIGVFGAFIACNFFSYNIFEKEKNEKIYKPKIFYFKIGAYIYVIFLFIQIIQTVIHAGGVIAVFKINRLDAFLNGSMLSDSMIIEFVKEGLKIFFYYYFTYLINKGKTIKAIILFSIPMIHHRFTAVTRYDFIAMAASLFVFFINRKLINKKHKINVFKLAILGIIGLYFALLFMRISNFTRFGESAVGINISFGRLLRTTILNDSLYYEYFHTLYESIHHGQVGFEYGLSWFIYPIVNIIPRAIWLGKPYTAFSARMTDRVYWGLTSGNPVVTFSIFGEGYVQFGILGVFICSFIFLKSRWINFKSSKKIYFNEMYLLILMFSLVTYMRSEAPIFYMMIDAIWLWVIRRTCTYNDNM